MVWTSREIKNQTLRLNISAAVIVEAIKLAKQIEIQDQDLMNMKSEIKNVSRQKI